MSPAYFDQPCTVKDRPVIIRYLTPPVSAHPFSDDFLAFPMQLLGTTKETPLDGEVVFRAEYLNNIWGHSFEFPDKFLLQHSHQWATALLPISGYVVSDEAKGWLKDQFLVLMRQHLATPLQEHDSWYALLQRYTHLRSREATPDLVQRAMLALLDGMPYREYSKVIDEIREVLIQHRLERLQPQNIIEKLIAELEQGRQPQVVPHPEWLYNVVHVDPPTFRDWQIMQISLAATRWPQRLLKLLRTAETADDLQRIAEIFHKEQVLLVQQQREERNHEQV